LQAASDLSKATAQQSDLLQIGVIAAFIVFGVLMFSGLIAIVLVSRRNAKKLEKENKAT